MGIIFGKDHRENPFREIYLQKIQREIASNGELRAFLLDFTSGKENLKNPKGMSESSLEFVISISQLESWREVKTASHIQLCAIETCKVY